MVLEGVHLSPELYFGQVEDVFDCLDYLNSNFDHLENQQLVFQHLAMVVVPMDKRNASLKKEFKFGHGR